ncbi:MAG TPA: pyrroline-5-carboxylate reductase [Rhodospirillales bacterium]|jgi:pyrroline-5-carboxylate reductase|nr:pyrroline-5-carboxylate reductase [Rhodospirillales bacterium]HJO68435.1 pyrroline-5-carboxylate reductase [Rhodospirillales bacterium]
MAAVLLVGCGKMGGALLEGWLESGFRANEVTVVEPAANAAAEARQRFGVEVVGGPEQIPARFVPRAVVFAVKPQGMDAIVGEYAPFAGAGATVLSIAAGKSIAYFQRKLGDAAAIVRSMPNTPAAVRRGITVASASALVSEPQRKLCNTLLEAAGEVVWIDDESLLDAVTATSGSGPAYVFLLVESLAHAGAAAGLPADLAQRLARATVTGSAALLDASPDSPETLRRNVTSPGGTTAAALKVLMAEGGMAALMERAVAAAAQRSRELAD